MTMWATVVAAALAVAAGVEVKQGLGHVPMSCTAQIPGGHPAIEPHPEFVVLAQTANRVRTWE